VRAIFFVAAALTAACESVPPVTDLPSTHPASALAGERSVPALRGPATDVVAPEKATPPRASMPAMGGGGR